MDAKTPPPIARQGRHALGRRAGLLAALRLRDEYLARDAQYDITIAELAKLIQATHNRRPLVRLARWMRGRLPDPK